MFHDVWGRLSWKGGEEAVAADVTSICEAYEEGCREMGSRLAGKCKMAAPGANFLAVPWRRQKKKKRRRGLR